MPALPKGVILMWYGPIATIPPGYVLCDGTHDTPDLRDLFILGAGGMFDPGDTGGSLTHTHEFTGDGHKHFLSPGPDLATGTAWKAQTDIGHATGLTDPGGELPPYYALAYIMKT